MTIDEHCGNGIQSPEGHLSFLFNYFKKRKGLVEKKEPRAGFLVLEFPAWAPTPFPGKRCERTKQLFDHWILLAGALSQSIVLLALLMRPPAISDVTQKDGLKAI